MLLIFQIEILAMGPSRDKCLTLLIAVLIIKTLTSLIYKCKLLFQRLKTIIATLVGYTCTCFLKLTPGLQELCYFLGFQILSSLVGKHTLLAHHTPM